MANEQVLRERWDEIYHQTDEYQDALRRAAIDRAARRARGTTAGAGTGQGEVLLAGLDDYQNQRRRQYMDAQRRRGQQKIQQADAGAIMSSVAESGAYHQELLNPDFSRHSPWANVSNYKLSPSALLDVAEDNANRNGKPFTAEDRVRGAVAGRMQPRRADIDEVLGSRDREAATARTEQRARADTARQQATAEEVGRIRRLDKMRQYVAPDLMDLFGKLPSRERDSILRAPPEQQVAMLSSHPARPVRRTPNTGGVTASSMDDANDLFSSPTAGLTGLIGMAGRPSPRMAGAPRPAARLLGPSQ